MSSLRLKRWLCRTSLIRPLNRSTMPIVCGLIGGVRRRSLPILAQSCVDSCCPVSACLRRPKTRSVKALLLSFTARAMFISVAYVRPAESRAKLTEASGMGGHLRPPGRVVLSSIRLLYARTRLLNRQARRLSVRLCVGCVDHFYHGIVGLRSQLGHDCGNHPHPAPPLPSVIERLRRTIGDRHVFLHQPIALYEDYPAQNTLIIDLGLATGLCEIRAQPFCLRFRQPEKLLIIFPHVRSLNHAASRRSNRFMGPNSRGTLGPSRSREGVRRTPDHGRRLVPERLHSTLAPGRILDARSGYCRR
jgi:hypothetical protein